MNLLKEPTLHLIGLALLLLLFGLLVSGARQIPLTADEPAYIAGGYALLARGQEALVMLPQRGYPPLPGMMESALLYLANPDVPVEQLDGWLTDYHTFAEAFAPYITRRTELVARMPTILLAMMLGAVIFRWGKDLWGPPAGLIALTVFVLDPTLRAHGRLANSDVSAVALGTTALYAAWRWSKKPSWRWSLGTGALLALTMLIKLSGLLWAAAAGVIMLGAIVRRRKEGKSARLLAQSLAAGGLSVLLLWAGYGFAWGKTASLPVPVPAPTHWEGLFYMNRYESLYFALGQLKYGSWWWYYPLAFLLKNPLPLLIGLGIGLVVLSRRKPSPSNLLALGFFPLLHVGVAISEGLNVGYRYMLPIHPFLHLIVSGGMAQWSWKRRGWLYGALGLWYAVTSFPITPYEIAYFNELVGGPEGGYRYLVDSNLAWGQSDRVMEAYLEEHPDVQAEPPNAIFRPAPGRYIVDASALQGVGTGYPEAYEWFRHREPEAIINYSLLLYEVPPYDIGWVAQCAKPAPPLNAAAIAQGTGHDDLHRVTFNCTRAWLYPDGGKASGIYALHHDLIQEAGPRFPSLLPAPPAPDDPFIARHLARARLSFEQKEAGALPPFALYEMASTPPKPPLSSAYAVSAEAPPASLEMTTPLSAPIALDGPLSFLGAATYTDGNIMDVETWWRVTDGSVARPFSIMAHLISPKGNKLEVKDGLGVGVLALDTGDVLVQRHRFSRLSENTKGWLRTGGYWLDTQELWPVEETPGANALLLHLNADH